MLTAVLLVCAMLGVSLFSLMRPATRVTLHGDAQTERALAQAKEALIAYASGRPVTNRPGELPCPDTNNNGTAEANCNSAATRIGRLPWATLGIPDLRDGAGERLWYAVSNGFKNSPAVTPLNSNTAGEFTVTGTAPASNVIAIVFAPGTVVGTQSRTSANLNNVVHYLEGENANGDNAFTSAAANAAFNDRLLAITPAMFFPAVEMAVARHLRVTLGSYYAANAYYPPANAFAAGCIAVIQGQIPADPSVCNTLFASFGFLPTWFTPNQWHRVLIYAVASACVNPTAPNCTGSGGLLTVNGNPAHAVILSPGAPYSGQSRPCTSIADCLEAPNAASYPVFTQTSGTTGSNDRLVTLP